MMRRLAVVAVLLAMATTASAEWNQKRVDGDDLRWVSSPDESMRLFIRTKPTGKVEVYVDFNVYFGQGEMEKDGLKTVWVFVWFDGKPYRTQDWPTGTEGRSMFVPDSLRWPETYAEKIRTSKTMTVEVLRPLDNAKLKATFNLQP